MRQNYDRFDKIISALKQVEPSASFDLKFKEALNGAVAGKHKEAAMERALRRIREGAVNLRDILLPGPPVLARVAVSFVIVMSVGLYIYSNQPLSPTLTAKEGVVMVQGLRSDGWKEAGLAHKLKVGDIIVTKEGSQLDIALTNKYAVRIKERTRLRVAKLTPRHGNGKVYLELAVGKVLVDVNKEGFKGSKFEVRTPTTITGVRGTKFSIDVSGKDKPKTKIDVLEGKVEVKSRCKPGKFLSAKQTVFVDAGQKTEVAMGEVPLAPQRMVEKEWQELEELYQIGKKPQIMLLVKNTPDRVRQLLKPCPIYISDEKPRQAPELLEKAVLKTAEAIKADDPAKHLESIRLLERIVKEYPNPKYNVQLMLYTGAYYEYLGYHEDAIRTFKEAILKYPDSPFASMAQCAIGIIYEEKLKNKTGTEEAYRLVLDKYPNSLEAIWVEEKLGIKKVG